MKMWYRFFVMLFMVCSLFMGSKMAVYGAEPMSVADLDTNVRDYAVKGEDDSTETQGEPDMASVELETKKLNGCITDNVPFTGKIKIISPVVVDKNNTTMTYSSNNKKMGISCQLKTNELRIKAYSTGSAKLTVKLNGKKFTIKLKISRFEVTKKSYVGAKKKSVTLKTKGASGKVKWSSSNSKVAKVSQKGKVKFLKEGNAIITATCGDHKAGCAVSVVSSGMLRVVKEAKKVGKGTYSQAKRMQPGYYDCSSLVWKAYKKIGKDFGSSNYAPVAAEEARWCMQHGKLLTKSYTRKDIQKMRFKPGDLAFGTGANNGRYKGIYHVEMFVGYTVASYGKDGKPVLKELWAARPEGYYGGGRMMMRP